MSGEIGTIANKLTRWDDISSHNHKDDNLDDQGRVLLADKRQERRRIREGRAKKYFIQKEEEEERNGCQAKRITKAFRVHEDPFCSSSFQGTIPSRDMLIQYDSLQKAIERQKSKPHQSLLDLLRDYDVYFPHFFF